MMLIDYIDRGARIAPDAPCMVLPDGTVVSTHAEFEDLTHRIAAALLNDGLLAGDRVAIFSPNDAQAFACVLGVIRAGGVWTAVNVASREEETAAFLRLTGCTRLIYHDSVADRVDDLLTRARDIEVTAALGSGRPGDRSLTDWLPPSGTKAPSAVADPERPVVLAPTGGTTGAPKAVPGTNRQLVSMCLACNVHLHEPEPPRHLCATPMTHAAGMAAFPVLAEGGSVVIHQGVQPARIFASIRTNRVSRLFLPPTALYALLAHPEVRDQDYSSLRHFLIAASPVAPERLAQAVEVFGPVMTQVFGQAEAPLMCTAIEPAEVADAVHDPDRRGRLASCGRATMVARVEIMDDEGRLLEPGEHGEIVVRSDLVFGGYWGDPEATDQTRRPGGWHGTGDIGMRDEDGYVYILDRKKDLIITGGFNVYPSQVEAFLHTLTGVKDCAVIGVPDEKWGEAVTAIIEPRPGATIDADQVITACKEALGSVKAPKSVEVRELPRSGVGKVLRRELRGPYWAHLDRNI